MGWCSASSDKKKGDDVWKQGAVGRVRLQMKGRASNDPRGFKVEANYLFFFWLENKPE